MRKSIKGKFILLLVLLSLTPLAIIFAIYSPSMLKDLTTQACKEVHTHNKGQLRLIALWIKAEVRETELLATSPQVISCLKEAKGEAPGLKPFLEGRGFIGLYLFDKEGNPRVTLGREAEAVLPYLDKGRLKGALQGNLNFFPPPIEKMFNHSLFVSVPVLEAEEVLGVLVATINLYQTKGGLEDLSPPGAYSFLVDGEGKMLACLTSKPDWIGLKTVGQKVVNLQTGLLTEGVKACMEGRWGYSLYAYTSHLGQKVLGAWGWIPELGVGVVVEVDAREAFLPVSLLRGRLWWLLFVVGVGVAVVAIFIGRKLSEPLILLALTTQKIAQGELKERVPVQSQDEIGELAQSINTMADSLREKHIQLSKANEKLAAGALRDSLTGLYDHQHFLKFLETEYKRARRYNLPLSLLMIDLDHFKMVNDTYGHPFGDFVLREIARIFEESIRDSDILCRYGGEEFAVILPNTPLEGAYSVAEKLRRTIANLVFWQGDLSTKLTITVGISTIAEERTETKEDLIKHADESLYEGKHRGRNMVVSWGELSLWEKFMQRVEKEMVEHYRTRFLSVASTMKRTYMEATMALVKNLEAKDGYTATHCYLVAMYAGRLAETLGLPQEEIEVIKDAAILHDIGKVSVPDNLLSKPGALTEEEYAIIKRHPEQAARILDGVGFLQQEIQIIMCHQEWYNGQGYPTGIKGEEIPLGARILSICDTFEALTSPRPYRLNVSAEKAFEILRKEAGTKFDPNLVEPFIKAMQELLATNNRMYVPQLNKTIEIIFEGVKQES
jgi:diguanylate cyclase (GGDEF)-like protein/putative nucleotidyltransferase with HDIG domain